MNHRRREILQLLAYIVALGVASIPLSDLIYTTWTGKGVIYSVAHSVSSVLGWSTAAQAVFVVGMYLGVLSLLFLDPFKRIHALLLSIATAPLLAVRSSPSVASENSFLFVGGICVGVLLAGGVDIQTILRGRGIENRQSRAMALLKSSIIAFLAVAFVDRYVVQDVLSGSSVSVEQLVLHGTALSMAGLLLHRFSMYEITRTVTILGPRRTGKSTFFTGLYYTLHESGREIVDTSESLYSMWLRLVESDDGWGEGVDWPDSMGESKQMSFTTKTSGWFPHLVHFVSIDYAGEYFNERLIEMLDSRRQSRSRLRDFSSEDNSELTKFRNPEDEFISGKKENFNLQKSGNDPAERVLNLVANLTLDSDVIVLIVDVGIFVGWDKRDPTFTVLKEEYLMTMRSIVSQFNTAAKDIIFVFTKADYLLDEGPIDDPDFETVTHPREHSYEHFRNEVEEWTQTDAALSKLIDGSYGGKVYPVFYEMEYPDSSKRHNHVPKRPLELWGFDAVLDEIIR